MNLNVIMAEAFTYFSAVAMLFLTGLIPVLINIGLKYTDKIHNENIKSMVITAVQAAQQSIPDNSAKYNYVAKLVHTQYPNIPENTVNTLIESTVHIVKSAQIKVTAVEPAVVNVTNTVTPAATTPAQ